MSTVGLITEYNPFHNGHLNHIEQSKIITGADTVIAVMSGSFVQRGEPAVIDKYTRTAMALNNGVNLVVELPTVYACSSAEYFSLGAIMTLAELGVDYVCFGSECGDIAILTYIAELLVNEPAQLSNLIKEKLVTGLSYPKARNDSLCEYLKNTECQYDPSVIECVLKSPNNVLGIEYIKTIQKYNLSIKPFTIKRTGSDYHDTEILTNTPSASAIRHNFSNDTTTHTQLQSSMPENVYNLLLSSHGKQFPVCVDDFSVMLNTKLCYLIYKDNTQLTKYLDVTLDFANRLQKMYTGFETFSELIEKLKNKQLTYTRVSRCLMHILLEITDDCALKYYNFGKVPYIRLLGFDQSGQAYLSTVKKKIEVPLITKTANFKELLREDIFAADLYNMVVFHKFGTKLPNEYKQSPNLLDISNKG